MGFANMSIRRMDGIDPVGPRIPEPRSERAKKDASTSDLTSKPTTSPRGAERTQLRTRSSEDGVFTLTTTEGDKITISFQNQQRKRVDQASRYGPDGYYEKTKIHSQSTSSLSVGLEGNLSEAELKDITDLVAQLSSGGQSASPSTIESYSFAYQQSSTVNWSSSGYTAKCSE